MQNTSVDDSIWVKRTRWLTQALILSGTLNIGLGASMVYFAIKKASYPKMASEEGQIETKKKIFLSSSSVDVIWSYFQAPYEVLLTDLNNALLVEDGLSKRDFALAFLVEFHHFDLERALPATELQVREVEIVHQDGGERAKLKVFPGLERDHFKAIESFARTEKWPFTAEGLHAHLKGYTLLEETPSSLKESIFLTPQFHTIWMLFNRFDKVLSMEELLKFFQKTEFSALERFHKELVATQDFSLDRRREFLNELLKKHSIEAAQFFLKYDAEFAFQKLDDSAILELIKNMKENQPDLKEHLKQLLLSLRNDEVHLATAKKLYEISHEKFPDTYHYQEVLTKFCPELKTKAFIPLVQESPSKIEAVSSKRYHIVKKGETLWQIARDYHVDLHELKKINRLTTSPMIKPGAKLEIPQGTGS